MAQCRVAIRGYGSILPTIHRERIDTGKALVTEAKGLGRGR